MLDFVKFPLFPLLGLSSVSMDIISSILSESFKNISSIKRCNCPDGVRRGTKSKYCLVVSRLGETPGTYREIKTIKSIKTLDERNIFEIVLSSSFAPRLLLLDIRDFREL